MRVNSCTHPSKHLHGWFQEALEGPLANGYGEHACHRHPDEQHNSHNRQRYA